MKTTKPARGTAVLAHLGIPAGSKVPLAALMTAHKPAPAVKPAK